MCASGHEVKGSSDDGDELHDLHAHAGSPGNPAIPLAIRAPKFAHLYALTATMLPAHLLVYRIPQEPNGDHSLPSDENCSSPPQIRTCGTSELELFIAVGTGISPRPPHGSVQALLR